jgi:nitroreductase
MNLQKVSLKMSDLTWIMKRKSVRRYKDQTITAEDLQKILRAAMAAPSAVNQQLWEFVTINDPQVLKPLGEGLPFAKMLLHAHAAIVVCGNLTKTFDHDSKSPYWIMDCSAATENILLAVETLGLGAVWTAVYPDPQRIEVVRRILALPEFILPLNVIPIGVPAVEEAPKDKWNPDRIHWNHW